MPVNQLLPETATFKFAKFSLVVSCVLCILASIGLFCYSIYTLEIIKLSKDSLVDKHDRRKQCIALLLISIFSTIIELVGLFAAAKENLILCTVFASLMTISLFFKFHFQAGVVEGVSSFIATLFALSLIYLLLKIPD